MNGEGIEQERLEEQLKAQKTQDDLNAVNLQNALSNNMQDSLLAVQLEVLSVLEEAEHMLREQVKSISPEGNEKWSCKIPKEDILLTEGGVNKIMSMLSPWVNKNTLLSHFTDEQISEIMQNFGNTINDDFIMNYETYLRTLTDEEIAVKLKKKVSDKVKRKIIQERIVGHDPKEKEIEQEVLSKLDIARDWDFIYADHFKMKKKRYPMLIESCLHLVFSTLMRAWHGIERSSSRQHVIRREGDSKPIQPQQTKGKWNPFGKKEHGG